MDSKIDIDRESDGTEIVIKKDECHGRIPSAKDNNNSDDLLNVDSNGVSLESDKPGTNVAKCDFVKDDNSEISVDITPEKDGGVLKKILKEGEGDEHPRYGDRVSVHYTGWRLGKEAVEFDNSRKGEKFEFSLGRGQVIKGWDLGLSTMKKGEVAVFICHPRYAYGDMGYPPAIPPFTPLIFEIELFDWKLEDLSPKKDDSILRKVLEKGDGNAFPNEGSRVKGILHPHNFRISFKKAENDHLPGEGGNFK